MVVVAGYTKLTWLVLVSTNHHRYYHEGGNKVVNSKREAVSTLLKCTLGNKQ